MTTVFNETSIDPKFSGIVDKILLLQERRPSCSFCFLRLHTEELTLSHVVIPLLCPYIPALFNRIWRVGVYKYLYSKHSKTNIRNSQKTDESGTRTLSVSTPTKN